MERNVPNIVLGLKEEEDTDDLDEFNDIVRVVGLNAGVDIIKVENIERLGTLSEDEQHKVRPMKVTLETSQQA